MSRKIEKKPERFIEFETQELRYLKGLFGEQHKDSPAGRMYDEVLDELQIRADEHDRDAIEEVYG